jgi:uncharacterized protein YydD (DUF2326 family)|tara:strand:+ start:357 stop:539 length:183 start_codon:yes stop_codon:yes gene_type:complete
MALENTTVLANLQDQFEKVNKELGILTNTRMKLIGAIEVLEQIENSKVEVEEQVEEEGEE